MLITSKRAALSACIALAMTPAGVALAQEDPPPLTAQLCDAATIADVNALLGANLDVDLPAGVRDAVNPAVAAGSLVQVRGLLGCVDEPPVTETPAPSTEQPPPDDGEVLYETCADAIAAGAAPIVLANGEQGYRAELDRDGDGIACEANEGPAPVEPTTPAPRPSTDAPSPDGFSQLDDVPSRAAETGGGPA